MNHENDASVIIIDSDEDEDDRESSDGNDFVKSLHKAINRSIANINIQEDYYTSDEIIIISDDEDDDENLSAEDSVIIDETSSSTSEAVAQVVENDEDDQHQKDESLHIEPEQQSNKSQELNEDNEAKSKQLNSLIEKKQKMLPRIKEFIKGADPNTRKQGSSEIIIIDSPKNDIKEVATPKLEEVKKDSENKNHSPILSGHIGGMEVMPESRATKQVATPKVKEVKEDSGNKNQSPILSGHIGGMEVMPESRAAVLAKIESTEREAPKMKRRAI